MKKLILILGLVTASLFGAVLFGSQKAYAATGEAVDRSTIKIGEQIFFDSDVDDTFRYEETNPTDNCPDKIDGFSNGSDFTPGNTPADATLTVRTSTPGSSNCSEQEETITFGSSRSNFLKAFVWIDENTIGGSDGKLTFARDGTSNIFVSQKENQGCSDTITLASNNQFLALHERKGGSETDPRGVAEHDYDWYPLRIDEGDRSWNEESSCWESPVINGLAISGSPEGGNEGAAPGAGNSGVGGENEQTCESEGGGLSWLLCPILYLGDAVVRKLDQALIGLLSVPNDYVENEKLQEAWSRIRDLSYIILVPIVLVMVISTALGFDFISAYTVKKALPRLIAAAIFIALSFEISKFLIILTNNIGTGIHGLIIGAFANAESISIEAVFSPNHSDSFTSVGVLGLGITGALAVGSIGIILSYILVAIVGLAIGFFLLSLRQMLIIALLLVGPLAILAWIFPGNDRLWKLWWGSFSKLLLLFPLIMLLVAVGKSFALLVAAEDGSFVSTVLKLAAYIGPYFLIPATFKFAGGTFATLAGMANDRGRGLFDRNKKYRQAQMAQNWQDTRAFNRFKGSSAFSRKASGALGFMSNANRAGFRPDKWKGRLSAAKSDVGIEQREALLEDKDYTWKGNDGLNRAAAESSNEAQLRKKLIASGDYTDASGVVDTANLNRDVAKVERMRRKYGTSAFRQATWLQAVAGGTAYKDTADAWQAAGAVANGDNAVLADMVAKGRSAAMGAGRVDQGGAGFMDTFRIAQKFGNDPSYTLAQANTELAGHVINSQGAGTIAHSSMKPNAVQNLVPVFKDRIKNAVASGNQDAIDRELAVFASVHDELSRTSPNKAELLADQVLRWDPASGATAPAPGGAGPVPAGFTSVQDLISQRRNASSVFQSTHREYGGVTPGAPGGPPAGPAGPIGGPPAGPVGPPAGPPT